MVMNEIILHELAIFGAEDNVPHLKNNGLITTGDQHLLSDRKDKHLEKQLVTREALNGKVAVITGGNSGIGLATAMEFQRNGARVAILGRDQKTLDAAAREIGDGTLAIQGDVRDLKTLDHLFEAVGKHFGKVDILVANAGMAC